MNGYFAEGGMSARVYTISTTIPSTLLVAPDAVDRTSARQPRGSVFS